MSCCSAVTSRSAGHPGCWANIVKEQMCSPPLGRVDPAGCQERVGLPGCHVQTPGNSLSQFRPWHTLVPGEASRGPHGGHRPRVIQTSRPARQHPCGVLRKQTPAGIPRHRMSFRAEANRVQGTGFWGKEGSTQVVSRETQLQWATPGPLSQVNR